MKKFNWIKAISFGLLTWGSMALLVFLSTSIGIFNSMWTQLALVVIAGVISYSFTANIHPNTVTKALGYGLIFVTIGAIFDLSLTEQFLPAIFSTWMYWAAYAFVLAAPVIEKQMEIDEEDDMRNSGYSS